MIVDKSLLLLPPFRGWGHMKTSANILKLEFYSLFLAEIS